jgi:hypothetical protein
VLPYGETPPTGRRDHFTEGLLLATDFEKGAMVGLLVGEGHFGGDGRQPQVTLRMHVRHEALFHWIEQTFPGGKLYGPYNHDGRHYFQWMARGSYLREILMPILDQYLTTELDAASAERYEEMKVRYQRRLRPSPSASHDSDLSRAPGPGAGDITGRDAGGEGGRSAEEIFSRLRHEPPL